VFKFLSVNNIVIAPANTGRESSRSTAVINTDQTNKDILRKYMLMALIFTIVVMKLIAPNKDDTPAKCKLKIAKSIEGPE